MKKRLRKDGVPGMLRELRDLLAKVQPYEVGELERAVHEYAERSGRKMGDVVNPLRVAVTGQGIDELKWALAKRVQPVEVAT